MARAASLLLLVSLPASLLASFLASLLMACSGDPEPRAIPRAEAEKLAFEASGELLGALLSELSQALPTHETHEALNLCADIAQSLTERMRKKYGVDMRRTALRYRNPKNAPDEFERAWMEQVVAQGAFPTTPHSEVIGGELRYLRPIGVAQLCTECHGPADSLDPRVKEALAKRYPDDRATGFVPGDFRGVVSVRIPVRD